MIFLCHAIPAFFDYEIKNKYNKVNLFLSEPLLNCLKNNSFFYLYKNSTEESNLSHRVTSYLGVRYFSSESHSTMLYLCFSLRLSVCSSFPPLLSLYKSNILVRSSCPPSYGRAATVLSVSKSSIQMRSSCPPPC
jgi:hypothetical protein